MGVSIDGFVAVPSGGRLMPVMEGEWGLPPEDPDLTQRKLAWVWEAGAHIMGRTTYEEMAAYWPSSASDYAAPMNEIPKVVFSKTLERAEWPDSRIARGDLAEEIATLKREPGKDVVAYGGAAFAQSLARLGLIDEYRLITHPVAVANGQPLFKDLPTPSRLAFVEARPFRSAVLHVYEPACVLRPAGRATLVRRADEGGRTNGDVRGIFVAQVPNGGTSSRARSWSSGRVASHHESYGVPGYCCVRA